MSEGLPTLCLSFSRQLLLSRQSRDLRHSATIRRLTDFIATFVLSASNWTSQDRHFLLFVIEIWQYFIRASVLAKSGGNQNMWICISTYSIRHLLCIKVACVSMEFWCTINDEYCRYAIFVYIGEATRVSPTERSAYVIHVLYPAYIIYMYYHRLCGITADKL